MSEQKTMACKAGIVDTSVFDDQGWQRTAIAGTPEATQQLQAVKVQQAVAVTAGELSVTVGPLRRPDGQGVAVQGDVQIVLDGRPVKNVQRIVITGDARTGWSAELTLYPLITRK